MSAAPHALGARGERLAARFLERAGYTILARNYRLGHREIDLIISRDELVAFVEVKARAGAGFGHPLDAITALKRREIERVAHAWVARSGRPELNYRFDAIAILYGPDGKPLIDHVPGAWRLGE